ncbi:MAG: hypothetical protein K9N46_07505 [Candidatus Marinimicrobia bacterium]|nr:hypothetical protein [Candidatus Neomarinimicrobiota bacterium]MCF7880569.1 hypothetical protein [Candidatus Neomarinimicrobiota bacterium]
MNLNLIASFVIGGLILLSILDVNNNIREQGVVSAADYQVKTHTSTVAEVLSEDIRKVGYLYDGNSPVETITATSITFHADVTGDDSSDTIKWIFDTSRPDMATSNPSDTVLHRIVNADSTDFSGGVNGFALTFYDSLGVQTTNPATVKKIRIVLTCESLMPMDGTRYARSGWQKTFRPINLDKL